MRKSSNFSALFVSKSTSQGGYLKRNMSICYLVSLLSDDFKSLFPLMCSGKLFIVKSLKVMLILGALHSLQQQHHHTPVVVKNARYHFLPLKNLLNIICIVNFRPNRRRRLSTQGNAPNVIARICPNNHILNIHPRVELRNPHLTFLKLNVLWKVAVGNFSIVHVWRNIL